ncbi:MAG: serine--tRNA ligase [Crenarchaeota archaeon]|nr:MAG: serine--tRNA ligase [Thermoproteota archaeon]RDJ33129.1 MAG: serine--tRNA ligase [Thermoproteota archaeon]RDJ36368.1 MAG: serine--tRNA ligase [Thermoproteota archaeon]RDJ38997.1 MAG: serine--tRNA ligase [Thermoproteota archaeon]
MLDPKFIRENVEEIRSMLEARCVNFDLEKLLDSDQKRRDFIIKTDELRQKKNQVALQIAQKKKSGEDASEILNEMKTVSEKLAKLEMEQNEIERDFAKLAYTIPNLIHESVPKGKDETANKEIRAWGNPPKFDFKIHDHIDISADLDLVDLERAAKVAGARFYYLKNDLVRLNQALINYALDFLNKKNYSLIQPPYMIKKESMEGAVISEDFEEVIYKIQDEDLYLIGTSEHAMAAMHSGEIMDGNTLPIRYAGVSPCFRKEAGAHGRDQKGIFRVHQFEKIEQFVFARPEDSWKEHERMLSIAEEFYQSLEIPHRVMLLSSADMGKVSAKTYDIEAWMAGQNSFREIVSCSNCLDYQARRLKIRFRDKTNEDTQFLHTLNSTLVATSRVLVSLLENFQTKDGHVSIPKILRNYIGKDSI